jgi:hypothetical protein
MVEVEKNGSVVVSEGRLTVLTVNDYFPDLIGSLLYQKTFLYNPRSLLEYIVSSVRYGYNDEKVYNKIQEEVRWGFTDTEKKAVAATIARRNRHMLTLFGNDVLMILCHNTRMVAA